jgi:hypothetical protein
MVNNNTLKIKYRKIKQRKTKQRKTKQRKIYMNNCSNNYRKFAPANSINRIQIGCSNKRNKVMIGGGVNAITQPLYNTGYSMYGGLTNAYNSLYGYTAQSDPAIIHQPFL